jgi:LmbE family N-acetylglucosaminyl deacetylase
MTAAAAVASVLLAIAAGACLLRMRCYRRWSRRPAGRTEEFRCRGSQRVVTLLLAPDGVDLPSDIDLRGQTVLLYLTVSASLSGHLLDPFIELRHGARVARQYFERGACGQHYLNLSSVFGPNEQTPLSRINMRGRWLRWQANASLMVFEPPAIANARLLVLAPHPDDAEIAAFGMYARHRSTVVTITAGEKATANLPTGVPAQARAHWAARLRVADSLSVPQLGDVAPDQCANLVYPDGALAAMFADPSRGFRLACERTLPRAQLRASNAMRQFQAGDADCRWDDLVRELGLLLELTQPDILICPHPLVDSHPDHVFTTVALERALRDYPGSAPLLLLYAVHSRTAPLYPFGPSESIAGLPPGRHAAWVAESIYSYPLESKLRRAKYFAVEAMHAVRAYAHVTPKNFGQLLKSMGDALAAYLAGLGPDPASFLRRAPRPNEIYYVVRGELLSELLQQRAER